VNVTSKDGEILLQVARHAIDYGLEKARQPELDANAYSEVLQAHRASFVTLKLDGRLRGCMGTLTARQAAVSDVCEHAYLSAFSDPRFSTVSATEAPLLDISLSLLSPQTPIEFASEAELLRQLRPHVDGLILKSGARQATFLPAVWESLAEPSSFVEQLKLKANFASGDQRYEAWRYTVDSIV
jgi:AmmeMemoRadiSam system protein A